MAISNTNILIKRSISTGKPTSLKSGEFAYSYLSNTLFFGTPSGDGVVNIGGQYYTSTLDAATNANTVSTLVKRNENGAFSGRLYGNANTSTVLETARDFSISGGDITATTQSFDGSASIVLGASLNTVAGLSAGVYGGTTAIPVVTVAANGRVMSISNTSISTSFNLYGDSGVTVVSGGDSLTLSGGQGISSSAGVGPNVTFDVDDTVVRSNGFTGGTQTINTNLTIGSGKDLTVSGNLIVTGNVTSQNVQQLAVNDPLIVLGIGNYVSDTLDIGFAAHYNDGSNAHTGLIRDSVTKEYHFFQGYTPDIDANNNIDLSDASYREANVSASYFKGNLIATTVATNKVFGNNTTGFLNLYPSETYDTTGDRYVVLDATAPDHIHVRAGGAIDSSNAQLYFGGEVNNIQIDDTNKSVYIRANNNTWTFNNNGTTALPVQLAVPYGGTGKTSFTSGQLLVGDGSGALQSLSNAAPPTIVGTLTAANTITTLTFDDYGRVTTIDSEAIAISTSQITSGTLGVTRGGTGQSSFTTGAILIGNSSGSLQELANSSFTPTGSGATNNTITSVSVDAYGRFTAATFSAISGLTVGQGGTGVNSFTTNGITYGNGSGAMQVTAAAGDADQSWSNQILTVTNAGTPIWTTALDGGTF